MDVNIWKYIVSVHQNDSKSTVQQANNTTFCYSVTSNIFIMEFK